MGIAKLLMSVLMLILMVFLSITFGLFGFLLALGMSIILSMMFTRIEREKLEKKRHKELLDATKK